MPIQVRLRWVFCCLNFTIWTGKHTFSNTLVVLNKFYKLICHIQQKATSHISNNTYDHINIYHRFTYTMYSCIMWAEEILTLQGHSRAIHKAMTFSLFIQCLGPIIWMGWKCLTGKWLFLCLHHFLSVAMHSPWQPRWRPYNFKPSVLDLQYLVERVKEFFDRRLFNRILKWNGKKT